MTIALLLALGSAQQSSPPPDAQNTNGKAQTGSSTPAPSDNRAAKPTKSAPPKFEPPRSDRVNVNDLGNDIGESSSKATQIDLSAPSDDAKTHPQSGEAIDQADEELSRESSVGEFHPWDPHKAAKNVEVGDFYFKRKNYRGAEDRYREALFYKQNDAIATFRLAVCLEKLDRPEEARAEYESYLRILPHGPQAEEAQKSIERLKTSAAEAQPKTK